MDFLHQPTQLTWSLHENLQEWNGVNDAKKETKYDTTVSQQYVITCIMHYVNIPVGISYVLRG